MLVTTLQPTALIYPDYVLRGADNTLKIAGTVNEKSVPIPCRVRLFERASGILVADTATDAMGNYVFLNLVATTLYYLVAHHPTQQYNAVIQDRITPK